MSISTSTALFLWFGVVFIAYLMGANTYTLWMLGMVGAGIAWTDE